MKNYFNVYAYVHAKASNIKHNNVRMQMAVNEINWLDAVIHDTLRSKYVKSFIKKTFLK